MAANWFVIIQVQFNERLAWWVALCLAVAPVICMTATKVLTDSLAAGLLSAQILAAVCLSRNGRKTSLLAASLLGAAAAGARPQLILVVCVVLATALIIAPGMERKWLVLSCVGLIGTCLLWLVPMWYIQSQLKPQVSAGSVYPHLLYKFWAGRFEKPNMYLFAGKWTLGYLAGRCAFHFLGWFGVGFGFIQSWWAFVLGTLVSVAGVTAYVVIVPILLVALLRGLLNLRRPWNQVAFAVPAVLLLTTIPIAIINHRDDAPPIRFVRYLQQLYPPEQRSRVVLLLSTRTKRHAEWYSPDFTIVNPIPPPDQLARITTNAAAVYTDDPWADLPPHWYRMPLNAFTRSVIIYWKVHYLELCLVDRQQGR